MNEKVIELLKWFIGSVVIVIVTLVVESSFRDRETGIEEMKVYNQYVGIILQSDNIEERWKLAEYFAVVTPTERLRERWEIYQKLLVEDYKKYKGLEDKENSVLSDTIIKFDSLVVIQKEIEKIGGSLIKKNNFELASEYEKKGFQSLLDKDVYSAINNFKLAEQNFNGFHQVYEIYLLLLRRKNELKSTDEWKSLYRDIINKYSWKMPEEFKTKMNIF